MFHKVIQNPASNRIHVHVKVSGVFTVLLEVQYSAVNETLAWDKRFIPGQGKTDGADIAAGR